MVACGMAKDKRDLRLIVIYPEAGAWQRSEQSIPNTEKCIRAMHKMIDYWWRDQKNAVAVAVLYNGGKVYWQWNKLDDEGERIYELAGEQLDAAPEW